MMGSQEAAPQLFYDFRLDDHVPADHMATDVKSRIETALKRSTEVEVGGIRLQVAGQKVIMERCQRAWLTAAVPAHGRYRPG